MRTKILLVEDEQQIRETICELLLINNFDIVSEEDGCKALQILDRWKPDIIISDIMMPNCNGYELLKNVRSNPKFNQIPFVFLTAKKPETDLTEANKLGVDAYITKPFKVDELIAIIEAKLKRYKELKNQSDVLDIHFDDFIIHEINTPLYGILGSINFLQENGTNSEKTDYLNAIKTSAENLNRTLTNIINYQKLSANHYYIATNATIEIKPCLNECLEKLLYNSKKYKNSVTVDVENTLVNMGRKDLLVILFEILDNALKFSEPQSEIKITGREKNNFFTLKVIDS
jgi:two-component system, sensor histidine kinase and response regulator